MQTIVGTWLSLVERTLGVGEVASSNLVVPTIYSNHLELAESLFGSKYGADLGLCCFPHSGSLFISFPITMAAMASCAALLSAVTAFA